MFIFLTSDFDSMALYNMTKLGDYLLEIDIGEIYWSFRREIPIQLLKSEISESSKYVPNQCDWSAAARKMTSHTFCSALLNIAIWLVCWAEELSRFCWALLNIAIWLVCWAGILLNICQWLVSWGERWTSSEKLPGNGERPREGPLVNLITSDQATSKKRPLRLLSLVRRLLGWKLELECRLLACKLEPFFSFIFLVCLFVVSN